MTDWNMLITGQGVTTPPFATRVHTKSQPGEDVEHRTRAAIRRAKIFEMIATPCCTTTIATRCDTTTGTVGIELRRMVAAGVARGFEVTVGGKTVKVWVRGHA